MAPPYGVDWDHVCVRGVRFACGTWNDKGTGLCCERWQVTYLVCLYFSILSVSHPTHPPPGSNRRSATQTAGPSHESVSSRRLGELAKAYELFKA